MSPDMSPHFLAPNNPLLASVAPAISPGEISGGEVRGIIERLLSIAYGEQSDRAKPILVGLAAPQVGIARRIILVDVAAEGHGSVGDLRVYINPEIIWQSPEEAEWYEGCYSTGRVCGVVSRPTKIRIKALSPSGEPVEETHSGYTARIFQHEIDHLNGAEFVSRITDDAKLHWVEPSQFPEYRDNEGWRHWPHKCSRERWNSIKGA
ncbi:MAG: putative Peptide deformylase [Patescibacteria group bacterium]|nr:putative Peptide deformylase [Patescibacteria group bacterium]